MRSLCLLDKTTWMLTDLYLSQRREAEQKQREELGLFVHPWRYNVVTFIVHALL